MNKLVGVLFVGLLVVGCSEDPEVVTDNTQNTDTFVVKEIQEVNTSFVVKHTGTKCGPCGTWGWDMFEDIIDGLGDGANYMAAFSYPGDYIIDVAEDLSEYNGVSGFPTFAVNNKAQLSDARSSGSVNTAQEKQMSLDEANSFSGDVVRANAGVIYRVKDNKLEIRYKVKAFQDLSANNLHVALYINENKVIGRQNGYPDPDNAPHKHLLRAAVDDLTWGKPLGALSVGEEISGEASVELGADWNPDNLEVLSVIYNKSGEDYEFINSSLGALLEE
ncbi:MAG: Omp28-related outer membrane protein [Bacteroidia bacterium]|nr:Omp28-related outer membrane protein [Bacteroidia bacterium]